jgi:FkbM family methyltransferase
MDHHPIFREFSGYEGPVLRELWIDWIGGRFKRAWVAPFPGLEQAEASFPEVGEEYFEWIDVLEAVANARDQFTMIELGAGFGRWGVRGAQAARQKGIREIDIRFLEAEPQHAAWVREALVLNGLREDEARVVEAAVSYAGRPIPFIVSWEGLNAANLYGQRITEPLGTKSDEVYFGKSVYHHGSQGTIFVDPITIEALVEDTQRIDLLDMDIQGAEAEVIPNAIETLNAKVRRVHIGTHGSHIETTVRSVFAAAGWEPLWDFGAGETRETVYGEVTFGDGIQTWLNPRLTRSLRC